MRIEPHLFQGGSTNGLGWEHFLPSSHTQGLRLGGEGQQPVVHSEQQEEENPGSRIHSTVGAAVDIITCCVPGSDL